MGTWTGRATPGWYPDPFREAAFRWYDGERWTVALADREDAAAPAPVGRRAGRRRFGLPPRRG